MPALLNPARPQALAWPSPVQGALQALLGCLESLALDARERQRISGQGTPPRLERQDLEGFLTDLDSACLEALRQDPDRAGSIARLLSCFPLLRAMGRHCLSLAWKGHRLEFMLPPFLLGPLDALAVESSAMALRAIEAFREGKAGLAQAVVDQDDWVDGVHHQMRARAVQLLMRDPSQALPTQALLDLAKHWEGLADSAVQLSLHQLPRTPRT